MSTFAEEAALAAVRAARGTPSYEDALDRARAARAAGSEARRKPPSRIAVTFTPGQLRALNAALALADAADAEEVGANLLALGNAWDAVQDAMRANGVRP